MNMIKLLIYILSWFIITSCTSDLGINCGSSGLLANGACNYCTYGTPTLATNEYGYCSAANSNGVACCTSAPAYATQECKTGFCWTVENTCCPKDHEYPCNGNCYNYNACNYSDLITACY
jgi:hypothetical protein